MSEFDFMTILNRMLGRIPDTFDKRQGSIIYDALSPAAAELAQMAAEIEIFTEQTYVLTATGENLDNRGADFSIYRYQATNAIRIGEMTGTDGKPIVLPVGSRFAVPNIAGSMAFRLIENLPEHGKCLIECETPGTIGNTYYGAILPLFVINNLGVASIIGTQIPARDIETDDEFRIRIITRMSTKSFGGNVADYKEFTRAIAGVGNLKVFPIWQGGGTVKLSIIDGGYDPITPEFIKIVKDTIDPEEQTGLGIGIAPIGHTVTVTTPERYSVDVEAKLLLNNRTVGQVQQPIEDALKAHFLTLRQSWADSAFINVFIAHIISAALTVPNIVNVTNVKINGVNADLILEQTDISQTLPYLNRVYLYE